MDHLPRPQNPTTPTTPPIEIPLMEVIPYDFQGFTSFPTRHGFTTESNKLQLSRPSNEIASMLQSWLYFGLLAEFIGYPLCIQHFVRSRRAGDTSDFISSAILEELLRDWDERRNSIKRANRPSYKELKRHIQSHIELAASKVFELEWKKKCYTPPIPEILLSIKILISTLALTLHFKPGSRTYLYGWEASDSTLKMNLPGGIPLAQGRSPSAVARFLMDHMHAAAWCPHQIHLLCSSQLYITVIYTLQVHRQHNVSHRGCSEAECLANNVELGNGEYKVRHVREECRCNDIVIPEQKMIEIIKEGGIPLVSIQSGPHGQLHLDVTKATVTSRYVALSHVWSDGMGNPKLNALPQCQLNKLMKCLQNLRWPNMTISDFVSAKFRPMGIDLGKYFRHTRPDPNGKFWMDTLCIPVGENHKELKTKAINQMAAIYAGASGVLVLDSEIEHLSAKALENIELLAHVTQSAWMRRSWTLQEGALSRCCQFRCADGAVDPIRDPIYEFKFPVSAPAHFSCHSHIRQQVHTHLLAVFKSAIKSPETRPRPTHTRDLVKVWNALALRSTTKREDVPRILANLLGFSAHEIMKREREGERMRAIFRNISTIPFSILFTQGTKERGNMYHRNRWVPNIPGTDILTLYPLMRFGGKNLCLGSKWSGGNLPHVILIKKAIPVLRNVSLHAYFNGGSVHTFHVDFCRQPGDEFNSSQYAATCIVLENWVGKLDYSTRLMGACLHLSEVPEVEELGIRVR